MSVNVIAQLPLVNAMLKGSCLCGSIRYELDAELLYLFHCHCKECRAFSGASHASNASIEASKLTISDDQNNLANYKTQTGSRYFCKNCGSSLYSEIDGYKEFPTLCCGTLHTPPVKNLDANLWLDEKCPWDEPSPAAQNFSKAVVP